MSRLDTHHFTRRTNQSGNVLIIGLILLLIISIITIATLSVPGSEVKMAHNSELQNMALAGAEDGQQVAEKRIIADFNGVPTFDFDADEQDCLHNGEVDIRTATTCTVSASEDENQQESYLVEYLGPRSLEIGSATQLTDRYYFRATGDGISGTGQRRVQSIVMTVDLPQ